ncbi:hypothetical protein [Sporosarcina sp. FSL K6-3457]|uniref:hypothetical protein n=1 Tax=Sporosarcina sp. FSL K6-3457 TaxID=2978204 RepID=UPI0030F58F9C
MKKTTVYIISILLFLIGGCASSSTGNDESEKAAAEPANKQNEEVTSNDTEIDVVQEEKGDTVLKDISLHTTLPDAFPTDFPVPTGVELFIIENETDTGMMYIMNYGIEGEVIDYYNQYRQYIEQAGYTDIIDASNGNADPETSLENISAELGGNRLTVGIMVSGTGKYDDGTIKVSIMYSTASR